MLRRSAKYASRAELDSGVRIPLPPVFACVVEASEDCRAVAFGEGGHLLTLLHFSRELRLGKLGMKQFFYIYILQSEADPQRFYTGLTDDLRRRLRNHNSGRIVHTSKWKPWQLKTYIALGDRERAFRLERYLKSASGRTFVKRHF